MSKAVLNACERDPRIFGTTFGDNKYGSPANLTVLEIASYGACMTETLTIRLPKSMARDFRAKTRAARTNPTEVLRKAAAQETLSRKTCASFRRFRWIPMPHGGPVSRSDNIAAATPTTPCSRIS